MFVALSAPADHARGPQYLAPALTAVHQAFCGRGPWELLLAHHQAHVGLLFRAAPALAPVVLGQLLAAYPDLRAEPVAEASFDDRDDARYYWTRLRLTPKFAPLVATEEFLDREERRLADPLAALLAVIASGRGEAVRPRVSLAVRPVGRVWAWWLRRRNRGRANTMKLVGPLWAVDVRLAVQAPRERKDAALAKLHELAGVFAQYLPAGASRWRLSRVRANRLPSRLPLWGVTYLTSAELGLLWHPPTVSVRTPQMRINESRELEPPPPGLLPTVAHHAHLAVLGRTAFRERRETFGILPDDRFRHVYVCGQTGVGKTTLLTNLIAADVAAGRSVVVLDPHGDMIECLLDALPPRRTNDVILFDPAHQSHIVTYNPLNCPAVSQRPLVVAAVVTSFKRIFGDSWGPRLEHILRNCVLTLLENPGSTLVSLHRLLTDDSFRKQLVGRTSDEMVRAFWQSEWASWSPHFRAEALSPVLNKIGAFTANPLLRRVLGDADAKLDLRSVLDSGQVLFCNLSKGRLGDDASTLLGSLLVSGLQLAAMSRADVPEHERVPAMLFVDEFQNFIASETFPTLLSEMRKFGVALHAANQYIEQLDPATAAAVWGNVGTIVAFRLGKDAEEVAEQLGGELTPNDLRSLPKYHAYVRLLLDGLPSRPFSMTTLPPPRGAAHRASIVRRVSHQRFGTTVAVAA